MVSEREIEEAIKAFQIAHTAKVDIPLEQSMRDALEAAARVRAENDAFQDAVVTGLGAVKMNADGTTERVDLRAEENAGEPVEALEAVIREHDPRHAAIRGSVPMSIVTRAYDEFAADLREALSALTAGKPEQAVASGWQPIETAPKDGKPVLLCFDHHPVSIGRYEYGTWVYAFCMTEGGDTPSGWMPLPAAPTAGGGDE